MWPGVIQYVVNLLVGGFLFVLMAAYMAVAAGVTSFGMILFLTPLILGGFCSSLALLFQRHRLSWVFSVRFLSSM